MALTTDEEAELLSLKGALLAIRTGKLPSRILYNGQETDYAKVDLGDLRGRVQELEGKQASRSGRTRGAIGVRYYGPRGYYR